MFTLLSVASRAIVVALSLSGMGTSSAEEPPALPAQSPSVPSATVKPTDPLEKQSFSGDFHQYQPGDIVPDLYRSQQYAIANWQLRKLPAPEAGSHWTFFGGCYLLITDAEGKILRIFSGEIIYR